MEQGAHNRTLYFIESGTLSVHYGDEKADLRIALVGVGTVLGEGAFFRTNPAVHRFGVKFLQTMVSRAHTLSGTC